MNAMQISRGKRQQGFTLIELVVVLIILGILAAFAIPRFINVSTDARKSAAEGLAGTLRSASALVHALALAKNLTAASGQSVTLEGQAVTLTHGYPTGDAAGISAAVLNLSGFTVTYAAGGVATFVPIGTANTGGNCQVTYTAPAAAGTAGTVGTPALASWDCS